MIYYNMSNIIKNNKNTIKYKILCCVNTKMPYMSMYVVVCAFVSLCCCCCFCSSSSNNEGPSSNQNTQQPPRLQPACHNSTCVPAVYADMSMLINEHMQHIHVNTFFKSIPPQCDLQNSLMFYLPLIRSSNVTQKT